MSKITINNLEIDLKDLKKQLSKEQLEELNKEVEIEVFVPKDGFCHYINAFGDVKTFYYNDIHNSNKLLTENNLIYRTKEEAEEDLKRKQARIRIIRKIAELNASVGWKVDWKGNSEKSYIYYFVPEQKCKISTCVAAQQMEDYFYFSPAADVRDQVLKECAEDYKIMLGVK